MRELNIGHTFPDGTKVLDVLDTNKSMIKFAGYTTKGEFIIATLTEDNDYVFTLYCNSLADAISAYEWGNRENSIKAHIERVEGALEEAIYGIDDRDLTAKQEDILEAMRNLRYCINV